MVELPVKDKLTKEEKRKGEPEALLSFPFPTFIICHVQMKSKLVNSHLFL